MQDQPTPDRAPLEAFIEAAWHHANVYMHDHGAVPDVMLLGRYEDEELLMVMPSSQDLAAFAAACAESAAEFKADVAVMVRMAFMGEDNDTDNSHRESSEEAPPDATEVITVSFRERNKPCRMQYAHVARQEGARATIGPVSSMSEELASSMFLDGVFGATQH